MKDIWSEVEMIEKEIAEILDGREYGEEVKPMDLKYARDNGDVIVFGASDDLMEFRGAIVDEVGVYDGDKVYIDKDGVIRNKCDYPFCPYFKEKQKHTRHIIAVWDSGGYLWSYITDIPHEAFDILEEGKKYCRGIVFSVDSV